eukprot:gnl/Hemi2/16495_TR5510_c0_g1_i1.p1 gnl/Hemi2/16495_TR5510_c0_g1~~gnl/Hemi2/16495_TR5510_c0_g1_i1.p1  ORF type:complete len:423 (-),score=38.96 gnl/Hemi2/16495_TR5510_c0_g1_i1:71-1339(-)
MMHRYLLLLLLAALLASSLAINSSPSPSVNIKAEESDNSVNGGSSSEIQNRKIFLPTTNEPSHQLPPHAPLPPPQLSVELPPSPHTNIFSFPRFPASSHFDSGPTSMHNLGSPFLGQSPYSLYPDVGFPNAPYPTWPQFPVGSPFSSSPFSTLKYKSNVYTSLLPGVIPMDPLPQLFAPSPPQFRPEAPPPNYPPSTRLPYAAPGAVPEDVFSMGSQAPYPFTAPFATSHFDMGPRYSPVLVHPLPPPPSAILPPLSVPSGLEPKFEALRAAMKQLFDSTLPLVESSHVDSALMHQTLTSLIQRTDLIFSQHLGKEHSASDIVELQQEFKISIDVPGVKLDDIKVEVDGPLLSVTSLRNDTAPYKPATNSTSSFTLPFDIAPGQVTAKLHSGVLIITIPKPPGAVFVQKHRTQPIVRSKLDR